LNNSAAPASTIDAQSNPALLPGFIARSPTQYYVERCFHTSVPFDKPDGWLTDSILGGVLFQYQFFCDATDRELSPPTPRTTPRRMPDVGDVNLVRIDRIKIDKKDEAQR